jgi:hypothetical protein
MTHAAFIVCMSALTPKADIATAVQNVHLVPKADIGGNMKCNLFYGLGVGLGGCATFGFLFRCFFAHTRFAATEQKFKIIAELL